VGRRGGGERGEVGGRGWLGEEGGGVGGWGKVGWGGNWRGVGGVEESWFANRVRGGKGSAREKDVLKLRAQG